MLYSVADPHVVSNWERGKHAATVSDYALVPLVSSSSNPFSDGSVSPTSASWRTTHNMVFFISSVENVVVVI